MKPDYEREGVKLYNADCLDVMKQFDDNSFDLVLTDPPYGIKQDKGFEGFGGFGKPIARRQYYEDDWDSKRPQKRCFDRILTVGQKVIITGGNYFADILPQSKHWVVWDKLNTMPTFGDCELIWTNIKRKSVKKVTIQWNGLLGKERRRDHPTQKPVQLMEYLIKTYTKPHEIILDPFMGSGTSLVAARKLGKQAVGIEISKKYFDIAVKRIEAAFDGVQPVERKAGQTSLLT